MKKKAGKVIAVSAVIASQLLLGACGNQSQKTSATATKFNPKSHLNVSWSPIMYTASPPTDVVLSKIEDKANATVKFNWIPDASKDERITAALSSGELSDIVSLPNLQNSSVRQALKSGMFWDVGKYLNDYPNLKLISNQIRTAASIDGHLYGVPFQKNLARGGLLIRKDWLDHLGLKVPTNLDELYKVAKAFTENDPDGDGKNDTFGFSDRNDLQWGSFRTLSSYFGAPNNWAVDKNGKFTPAFETKAYKDALNYTRDLYKNGYMDKDFAVTSKADQQQKVEQGKAGIYAGMIDIQSLEAAGKSVNPNFQLISVNKIAGPDGKDHIWSENSGVGGLMAFPKSQVKTEADLKRILQFVNDLINKDEFMYMIGGIQDTHYQLDDKGVFKITNMPLWQKDVQPLVGLMPSDITHTVVDGDPAKQKVNEQVIENNKFAVLDPTVPLDSQTENENGTELQKIITDATIKYIMGQIDDKGFDAAIDNWKKSGGDQMAQEYAESYKKANKK